MSLFVPQTFVGHSGDTLHWKIECDALTEEDWRCLALMACSVVPPFNRVEGIPRGGLPFAEALSEHVSPTAHAWLLVDDVWTTGESMSEALAPFREAPPQDADWPMCLVAFTRQPLPIWCRAVISVNPSVGP